MNKYIISALFLLTPVNFAFAGYITTSLGYSQANNSDINNPKGFNLKYRYEWDFPVGIIGSFTYMSSDNEERFNNLNGEFSNKYSTTYHSFSVGPAWRINDYVSIYGLVGAGFSRNKYSPRRISDQAPGGQIFLGDRNYNSSDIMYGSGFQFNVYDDITLDLGFERTRYKSKNGDGNINSFDINVGYRY